MQSLVMVFFRFKICILGIFVAFFFAFNPHTLDGFYEAENSFVVILSNENRFEVDASCRTFLQFMGRKTEYQRNGQ